MTPKLRALALPAGVFLAWLAVDQLFGAGGSGGALVQPGGSGSAFVLVGGALAVGLRLVVVFLLAPWAAWRAFDPR